MKVVAAHFPMKVQAKDGELLIENFLGEKYPRTAPLTQRREGLRRRRYRHSSAVSTSSSSARARRTSSARDEQDPGLRPARVPGRHLHHRTRSPEGRQLMADDSPEPVKKAEETEGKSDAVAPTPKNSSGRRRTTTPAASATDAARKSKAKEKVPKAPRRPTLDPNTRLLLAKPRRAGRPPSQVHPAGVVPVLADRPVGELAHSAGRPVEAAPSLQVPLHRCVDRFRHAPEGPGTHPHRLPPDHRTDDGRPGTARRAEGRGDHRPDRRHPSPPRARGIRPEAGRPPFEPARKGAGGGVICPTSRTSGA